jgi:hypothetical protein
MWIMWLILAVPGAAEPVPVLLTGGHVQRCGAGPGREPVAVSEPCHFTDVGQDPRNHHRPDSMDVHQP